MRKCAAVSAFLKMFLKVTQINVDYSFSNYYYLLVIIMCSSSQLSPLYVFIY